MPVGTVLAGRRTALHARANILQLIRKYFIEGGFLEVETPLRIPAPAPELHIDAIPASGWYLQTSPEVCMKRMLAAGYERLFQICRCWRDKERGSLHLPEFTMLEWYRTGACYLDLMEDCEGLMRILASSMEQNGNMVFRGTAIATSGPWERISVQQAYQRYGGISMEVALEQDKFDEVMIQQIEPMLGIEKPTFIYDYPAERGALARLKEDDPTVAERFELYIGGLEIANGFSELVEPDEQRIRFMQENCLRAAAGKMTYPTPEKFLDELSHIPPSAGIALGVDRLLMVLLDKATIDDVVSFTPEEL